MTLDSITVIGRVGNYELGFMFTREEILDNLVLTEMPNKLKLLEMTLEQAIKEDGGI